MVSTIVKCTPSCSFKTHHSRWDGWTLTDKLARAGLEPVWVLAGEKNVYGGQGAGITTGGFGGCLHHTSVFAMELGTLKSFGTKTEFHTPSADDLEKLKAC